MPGALVACSGARGIYVNHLPSRCSPLLTPLLPHAGSASVISRCFCRCMMFETVIIPSGEIPISHTLNRRPWRPAVRQEQGMLHNVRAFAINSRFHTDTGISM